MKDGVGHLHTFSTHRGTFAAFAKENDKCLGGWTRLELTETSSLKRRDRGRDQFSILFSYFSQ